MAKKKSSKSPSGPVTHQTAGEGYEAMTTAQGIPVSDNQNHLKAGARGPMLTQDFHFREKMFHFDHERIPERVVHARGYAAHGEFELTDSLEDVTTAKILTETGKTTPVFTRFSTVAGNKGSPDLARDVRGFAVKFYTDEGNWDLVGNNIPVFFIQDAIKFPDLIHAAKPEPDRGFPQAQTAHDNFWDFISLTPESMHMVMWIMSDRTIPRSLRFMEGFGVHTFRLINEKGKSTFVKFHWKPAQGLQSVAWNEAVKINGADLDFHRRDLWNAIEMGDYPAWDLGVQLFDQKFADEFAFDVLDATKLIPEEEIPVRTIGRMTLNRRVDNFFAETEQVAFCTQNVPPGIGFSNDPLLQGRNFSYLDTQLKRLGGPNFTHIPVNAPRCPVSHFQQDGHMAMSNPKGRANYEPNSWGTDDGGPRETAEQGYQHFEDEFEGTVTTQRSESFADHYSQARQFYISQTDIERKHIGDALVFELSKVKTARIREAVLGHLPNIDKDLAQTVADGLGMDLPKATKPAIKADQDLGASKPLSIIENGPDTFAGRKLGIFVSEGAPASLVKGLRTAIKKVGATCEIVTPKIGGVSLDNGDTLEGDEKIDGGPSVLYDAVALVLGEESVEDLADDAPSRDFVADAFAHCKFIGFNESARAMFEAVGLADNLDDGCVDLSTQKSAKGFVEDLSALRYWQRETAVDVDA